MHAGEQLIRVERLRSAHDKVRGPIHVFRHERCGRPVRGGNVVVVGCDDDAKAGREVTPARRLTAIFSACPSGPRRGLEGPDQRLRLAPLPADVRPPVGNRVWEIVAEMDTAGLTPLDRPSDHQPRHLEHVL